MRIPRRGVIAQRKSGGYVWAIYSLKNGVDESVFTTGSFTMSTSITSTPYLMAADGYTVDSSGKITLTSATRTNISALTAGKYIVSISSSSSTTTTSTQYVYKVTGVTSSGSSWSKTYTVSYERYESSTNAKGDDTGERVQSNTPDYPVDGLHTDGKWYVMLKGSYMAYVWDVFNVVDNGWKAEAHNCGSQDRPYGVSQGSLSSTAPIPGQTDETTEDCQNVYVSSTRPTINTDGTVTLSTRVSWSNFMAGVEDSTYSNYYFSARQTAKYYYYRISGYSTTGNYVFARERYDIVKNLTKGTYTGNTVESADLSAYPQDNVSGNYWYVYSHEYEKTFDNT